VSRCSFLLVAAALSCAHVGPREDENVIAVRAWLDGLRDADLAKLHAASALPFTLENQTNGQTTCSETVTSTAALARLFNCLISAEPVLRHELAFPDETLKRLEVTERTSDHVTLIALIYDDARGAIDFDLRFIVQAGHVSAVILRSPLEIE
jgi:hypothetical protein